jgi:hypothetical protein
MSHLDICRPSYGQKKGRESNWQFDSRPLKVGNRPKSDVSRWSATWLEKLLRRLQIWFRPRLNRRSGREVMVAQSFGSPNRDSFGTPLWESRDKKPFGCNLRERTQKILYGGRCWLPSSLGRGESSESKCPWLVPTPEGVPECELTLLWLVLDADLGEIIIVPLPNLILGLLARPSYPL